MVPFFNQRRGDACGRDIRRRRALQRIHRIPRRRLSLAQSQMRLRAEPPADFILRTGHPQPAGILQSIGVPACICVQMPEPQGRSRCRSQIRQ